MAQAKPGAAAVEWKQGLAGALPLADGSCDRVAMSLLLHHLDADGKRAALAEAHRVLRPGGSLHIADWGKPQDPLMRAGLFTLALFDGFDGIRDHAAGRLPFFIEGAGFAEVRRHDRLRTASGQPRAAQRGAAAVTESNPLAAGSRSRMRSLLGGLAATTCLLLCLPVPGGAAAASAPVAPSCAERPDHGRRDDLRHALRRRHRRPGRGRGGSGRGRGRRDPGRPRSRPASLSQRLLPRRRQSDLRRRPRRRHRLRPARQRHPARRRRQRPALRRHRRRPARGRPRQRPPRRRLRRRRDRRRRAATTTSTATAPSTRIRDTGGGIDTLSYATGITPGLRRRQPRRLRRLPARAGRARRLGSTSAPRKFNGNNGVAALRRRRRRSRRRQLRDGDRHALLRLHRRHRGGPAASTAAVAPTSLVGNGGADLSKAAPTATTSTRGGVALRDTEQGQRRLHDPGRDAPTPSSTWSAATAATSSRATYDGGSVTFVLAGGSFDPGTAAATGCALAAASSRLPARRPARLGRPRRHGRQRHPDRQRLPGVDDGGRDRRRGRRLAHRRRRQRRRARRRPGRRDGCCSTPSAATTRCSTTAAPTSSSAATATTSSSPTRSATATCSSGGNGRDNASWARFDEGVGVDLGSGQAGRPGGGDGPELRRRRSTRWAKSRTSRAATSPTPSSATPAPTSCSATKAPTSTRRRRRRLDPRQLRRRRPGDRLRRRHRPRPDRLRRSTATPRRSTARWCAKPPRTASSSCPTSRRPPPPPPAVRSSNRRSAIAPRPGPGSSPARARS